MRIGLFAALVFGVSAAQSDTSMNREWWTLFNDPSLNTVVSTTLQENRSLVSGRAKVDESRQQSKVIRSQLLPSISANGRYNEGDMNGYAGIPGVSLPSNSVSRSLTLDGRYELDSWAEGFQQYKSAKYQSDAAQKEYLNSELQVTSQVVGLYFDAIQTKLQLAILERQKETARTLVELTKMRYEKGQTSGLALLQQQQQLSVVEANIPPARLQYESSLEYLSAVSYMDISKLERIIPDSLPHFPTGDDSLYTIGNRLDIKAAELRELASRSNLAKTRLVLVPGTEVNGSLGYDYGDPGTAKWEQKWAVGAQVSIPIFTGGAVVSGLRGAKANYSSAIASKEQVISNAKAELQNVLTEVHSYNAQVAAYGDQYAISQKVYDESLRQYRKGLTAYIDVLSATNSLQRSEITLLRSKRNLLQSKIQLVKAIGGVMPSEIQ